MHHMRSFVQQEFGNEGWRTVLNAVGPADAGELGGLLPVGWYSLGLQHRLLRTIDDTLGSGDAALVTRIGQYEAQQDLTVVHRLFLRMANPGFVLQQVGRYWGRFYKCGTWEVERQSSKQASGRLRDVDPFDPLMADYLHAYIREMWTLMGVTMERSRCRVEQNVIYLDATWR